jgi:AraC family transcriptional regulator
MVTSPDAQGLLGAERPFFTTRESLDDIHSMSSVAFAHGDLSFGRYRRDRPGLGITSPNPVSPMMMAVIVLRPLPARAGWRDGRTLDVPALGAGSLACLDLREPWAMDLSDPFDSFHAFIPLTAFDEITDDLRLPRIERLDCAVTVERRDETMLNLARALNPALAHPHEATTLFADHIFSAMAIHLAVTYGDLDPRLGGGARNRVGALSPQQLRLVMGRLLDDLATNTGVSELAALCGLSRSYFVRAFKQTTGLPPHRWLLLHRVRRAKELLKRSRMPINQIALECGFADQSHLTRVFTRLFAISPGAWRRQWLD